MLQHHTPKCDKFMFNLKFKHMIYLSTKVPIFLVRKCFLIMKLTAILITFLTIQSSAFVYSQETKLNLSIDNQKITQILKKIKSKTEFKFIYKSDLFSEMPVMSIHVEQATIYEMKYKINLSNAEFLNTSNPTWTQGTQSYITEIALLDKNKDVVVMSKLQSPVLRQGIQQFVVKIDF